MQDARTRAESFCSRYGLQFPVALAPMAGACPTSLSIAMANAGSMGACGALVLKPDAILAWAEEFRAGSKGPFQMNLWIPDPPPRRDATHEAAVRAFLGAWGPEVPPEAGDARLVDFDAQCEALLTAAPTVVSSIMGIYPPRFVEALKARGIAWWATVTTVAEALEAERAGADAIVAQGMEAGGHRGAFDARLAEQRLVGLFALLPAVADAVKLPVVATGGIADARGIAAAFALGASAAQIGTGMLRTPEAKLNPAWADALGRARPEDTMLTRAFSGRAGRAVATEYVLAAAAPGSPLPAPYPVQRGLTTAMREAGTKAGDIRRIQAWAGQSAGLARAEPAGELVRSLWQAARTLIPSM